MKSHLEANKIITGDCVDIMSSYPDNSIGLIITSPPYNVGLNYDGFDDNLCEDDFRKFNYNWLAESFRISKESARMYVIISDKMLWWFREMAESVGWQYGQLLVWCKPNLVGKHGKITGDWNHMTENILLFRKGKRIPMQAGGSTNTFNWFVETIPQSNHKMGRHHPAQLPFSLCYKIISRTPGEPILDPFAGSGQVLRAAKSLKRSYIGIELVEAVAEKARDFVNKTSLIHHNSQLDLIT